jgi:hypothetical protein
MVGAFLFLFPVSHLTSLVEKILIQASEENGDTAFIQLLSFFIPQNSKIIVNFRLEIISILGLIYG